MSFPPHIFAGVSSIISLIPTYLEDKGHNETHFSAEFFSPVITSDPNSKDKEYRERVTTLVVAIYLVVLRRTRGNAAIDMESFAEMSQAALASAGLTDERFTTDVETWIKDIFQNGWVQGQEWFLNVPKLNEEEGISGHNSRERNADGEDDDSDDDGDDIVTIKRRRTANRQAARTLAQSDMGGLLPGLGTMMSHKIDWLSEEMREDYMMWKEGVLDRIYAIEQAA